MGIDNFSKILHIDLKDYFSSMSIEEKTDYKFLSNFIMNKCGIRLNRNFVRGDYLKMEELRCLGGLQMKQYPEELAKFLVFIFNNKHRISSYCEIGSERGGTFFVIDSFLRSINENMGNSLAIDIGSKAGRNENYNQYTQKYPQASFVRINSRSFIPEQNYDLCFIDAGHLKEDVEKDYNLMKKYSKIIAFHDIDFLEGVKEVWKSISGNKIEIRNENPMFITPVGIGILDLEEK